MKLWVKILSLLLLAALSVLIAGIFSVQQFNTITETIERDIPESIKDIQEASHLDELAKFIRYYDEVLTQSARNYAFTQDKKWEERYNNVVPKLDATIKEAIERGNEIEQSFFANIDEANIALVDMETQAFNHVNEGNATAAINLLEGEAYAIQKAIYENGLVNYVEYVGGEYDEILVASTETTDEVIKEASTLVGRGQTVLSTGFIISTLILILISLIMIYKVSNPITRLSRIAGEIGKGNFTHTETKLSKDEIGTLYKEINLMSDKLQEARQGLEQKVAERTKQLEESNKHLKDLDRAKSEFLNVTSHELKTPLTVIYAYLDIIEETKESFNEEQQKSLETIRRNTDQLKSIITNILESARIDSGKFELVYNDINPKKEITTIAENLSTIAQNKKLIINTNLAEDLPEIMTTDKQRFTEIFNNLISNAVKFTKKGSITIDAQKQGENLQVSISDTGEGIPEDKVQHLFEEFYQVDSSISRKYGGTGLGLSITKKIIELQGGTINVASKEKVGTTFTFTLPLSKKEQLNINMNSDTYETPTSNTNPHPNLNLDQNQEQHPEQHETTNNTTTTTIQETQETQEIQTTKETQPTNNTITETNHTETTTNEETKQTQENTEQQNTERTEKTETIETKEKKEEKTIL